MTSVFSADGAAGNWRAQIDGETLRKLTWLFERVVDTLGMIAPVLELAKNRKTEEKMRHLKAVTALAFRGHLALKAFSMQWALLLEECEKRSSLPYMEDFADILQEAKQITISDPPPSSVETDAAHSLQNAQNPVPAIPL
jgi:hypothetical protein